MHNIVFEVPFIDLCNIANELVEAALTKKISINPLQDDCLRTYLHRSGMHSWLASNVQGPYQLCAMANSDKINYYESPRTNEAKIWWKPNNAMYHNVPQPCQFSESVPILIRFEDASDAMFFKMTYLDGK